ncbi:MAG: hypothetical protein IJ724_02245 [Muribaculaceae bacterium]|nr:hypothetical protein [Muribaculaceae bacterium]MBR1725460.1 hypothetical protein [Muribaculaceae bacterium]
MLVLTSAKETNVFTGAHQATVAAKHRNALMSDATPISIGKRGDING